MLVKNYLKGIDTYEIFKLTHNSLNSRLNQILKQNHPFYIESHVIGYIHINTYHVNVVLVNTLYHSLGVHSCRKFELEPITFFFPPIFQIGLLQCIIQVFLRKNR